MSYASACAGRWESILPKERRIKIPRTFLMQHCNHWPNGGDSGPMMGGVAKAARLHDAPTGNFWCDHHKAPGVFDFSATVALCQALRAAGIELIIASPFRTPTWLSTTPTVKDAYGNLGGNGAPTDMTQTNNYGQALGKALRGLVDIMEVGNEFDYDLKGVFWRDTADKHVWMAQEFIYGCIQGSGGAMQFITGGHVAGVGNMGQFLSGRAPDGTRGSSLPFNGIGIHPSGQYPLPVNGSDDLLYGSNMGFALVREHLDSLGLDLPIYATEYELPSEAAFEALPDAKRTQMLNQLGLLHAVGGSHVFAPYSPSDRPMCGRLSPSPTSPVDPAAILSMQTLANDLPDSTIEYAEHKRCWDGSHLVRAGLTKANGTQVEIVY